MKKILLSLSAIALLAVGTVSCSKSDDNNPGPSRLTENFVEIGGDQYELQYTYLGYEHNAKEAGNSVWEQVLNPQAPNDKYVVYRLISLPEDSENSDKMQIQFFATKIDLSKNGWDDGRYFLPFTTGSNTIFLNSIVIIGDDVYRQAAANDVNFELGEKTSFVDGKEFIDYKASGKLTGIDYNTIISQDLDMLYYINVNPAAARGVEQTFDTNKTLVKDFKITK